MKKYKNKEWLFAQYIDKKRSMKSIANECGVVITTIYNSLVKYNIKRRKSGVMFHTELSKKRISETSKGRKPMLGKRHSTATKLLMSNNKIGKKNNNWKGGITFNSRKFRKSREYRFWRIEVLKRDDYKCKYENCGIKTNIAHHIRPSKEYPELRVELSNGMTVCLEHHKLIHKLLKQNSNAGHEN